MKYKWKKYVYVLFLLICYVYIFKIKEEKVVSVSSQETDLVVPEDKYEVALTFDDGPGESTKKLLDGLRERNVKATFFVIGQNAEKYPELIQQMKADGHIVGNHTYSHSELTCLTCENALCEIDQTNELIESICGERPIYLRPPFGECTEKLKETAGMFTILWDVDPYDWKTQDTDLVVKRIVEHVQDGNIILLHDIYDTSVEAALQVIDILSEENYEFVTVEKLLFP